MGLIKHYMMKIIILFCLILLRGGCELIYSQSYSVTLYPLDYNTHDSICYVQLIIDRGDNRDTLQFFKNPIIFSLDCHQSYMVIINARGYQTEKIVFLKKEMHNCKDTNLVYPLLRLGKEILLTKLPTFYFRKNEYHISKYDSVLMNIFVNYMTDNKNMNVILCGSYSDEEIGQDRLVVNRTKAVKSFLVKYIEEHRILIDPRKIKDCNLQNYINGKQNETIEIDRNSYSIELMNSENRCVKLELSNL